MCYPFKIYEFKNFNMIPNVKRKKKPLESFGPLGIDPVLGLR